MKMLSESMTHVAQRTRLAGGVMLLSAAALFAMHEARAELPPVQTQGSVQYVMGGIGSDESESIKQAMSQYSLALIFASPRQGGDAAYMANVQVGIEKKGGEKVLDVKADGPYLLVKLEPGTYAVRADADGKSQTRDVTVKAGGSTQIRFDWKD